MPKQAPAMKKRVVRGSSSGRPIMALLDLLGRRWTLRIVWELREDRALTSRALRSACDEASPTHFADAADRTARGRFGRTGAGGRLSAYGAGEGVD